MNNQLDELLALLKEAKSTFPCLRMGQILVNSVAAGRDLFYVRDEELLERLRVFIETHRKVSISTKGALAVVTGITFERGLDSLKQTIELMSGESINEIGLLDGRRLELCKASILKKCPLLLDVKPSLVTRDNYLDVLNGVINLVGETIKVDKIAL
jgi:hypothetical protein